MRHSPRNPFGCLFYDTKVKDVLACAFSWCTFHLRAHFHLETLQILLKQYPTHFVNRVRGAVRTETRVTGNLIILRRLLWGKSKCFAPLACMWHFPLSLMRRSVRAKPVLRPADLAEFGPRACFLTVHIFTNVKYSSAVSFDKAKRVLSAPSQ